VKERKPSSYDKDKKPGLELRQAKESKPPHAKDKKITGKPARLKQHPDIDMVRYRIEVGRDQGVMPKDIVGAIANEAGIDSQYIGQIKLFDSFSTIELPHGMPKDIFQHLKKVRIREYKLNISADGDEGKAPGAAAEGRRTHKEFDGKTGKKTAPKKARPTLKTAKRKPS